MSAPMIDEDDLYASSEDSDFAPDSVPANESEASESENDGAEGQPATKKRRTAPKESTQEDAGYDNSGDEAIIKKGHRKRRKHGDKTVEDEDEGGEGGLIKTRRQRAQEKEERKVLASTGPVTIDVDAVWAQMLTGPPPKPTLELDEPSAPSETKSQDKPADDDPSALVRIKRTYNFAGRVHTEEKLVARDSAEAKLFFQSQEPSAQVSDAPTKQIARRAFRSKFEPLVEILPQRTDLNLGMAARLQAGKDAAAKKLNTVEKSRMDWAGFVDKEGIKDELELAGKSKHSFAARQDFLARSEAVRDDEARKARQAGRV